MGKGKQMIINEKKPEPPPSRSEIRSTILTELEKVDDGILSLAYMFAERYSLVGRDITEDWTNAIKNNQFIESIYRKGYEDCEKDYAQKKRKDFHNRVLRDIKEE